MMVSESDVFWLPWEAFISSSLEGFALPPSDEGREETPKHTNKTEFEWWITKPPYLYLDRKLIWLSQMAQVGVSI